jgi:hypothetical protein
MATILTIISVQPHFCLLPKNQNVYIFISLFSISNSSYSFLFSFYEYYSYVWFWTYLLSSQSVTLLHVSVTSLLLLQYECLAARPTLPHRLPTKGTALFSFMFFPLYLFPYSL